VTVPKVCILTAGRGTRMGPGYAWINKALLPLDDKAIISHIIDACPADTRFVIGLGHLGDQVRGYLSLAHPETSFEFFEVDPWQGPGSGPGRSLRCCREALTDPFCFVPCDYLPGGTIDTALPGDWVGVARMPEIESARYCNFRVDDGGRVAEIRDKQAVQSEGYGAFTGLMRVEHTGAFWAAIDEADEIAGEIQVSSGLGALQALGTLRAIEHPWVDVGEELPYRAEIVRRHGYDFSKPGEALFIVNGRVIKLFEDHAGAERRVERGRSVPGVFPEMLDAPPGSLAYPYVEGRTLYSSVGRRAVERLLGWCEAELWAPCAIGIGELGSLCDTFYRLKTLARVADLESMGGLRDEPALVSGHAVPGVRELLDAIDWADLCAGGCAVRFHGDLQFDNIIARPDGGFTLLDWRQDFAGRIDAGDLDYDLAKMLGGVRVNYARVKRGELGYRTERTVGQLNAIIDLPACDQADDLSAYVLDAAERMGRDPGRIRLLTALIHLNMAPLHAEPFASALRDLARVELAAELVPA